MRKGSGNEGRGERREKKIRGRDVGVLECVCEGGSDEGWVRRLFACISSQSFCIAN